jgi:threonine dehydrogenase-like Zn-dependent dehydrogenase
MSVSSMRALRIGGPLEVTLLTAPLPQPPPGELLVRVAFAGICATDRKLASRGSPAPRIPGHEISGWLADGTPVGVHSDLGDGTCRHCRMGYENRCPRRVSIGLDREGGMAEWLAAPQDHVLAVDDLPLDVAAVLEPLACCLHATALLGVEAGMPALVVGAGPMGVLAMWALQAQGARVAVCETSPGRRHLAAELGAAVSLGVEEDLGAVLGAAPLAAVVTAPGSAPLTWALERMEPGGRVHAFAGTPGGNAIDANVVHYRHLALVGSTGSSMRDYREAYELVRAGRLPLERLPRDIISLEEAVETLRAPDAAPDRRPVIDMGRS